MNVFGTGYGYTYTKKVFHQQATNLHLHLRLQYSLDYLLNITFNGAISCNGDYQLLIFTDDLFEMKKGRTSTSFTVLSEEEQQVHCLLIVYAPHTKTQ